jgi:hypothetical protein
MRGQAPKYRKLNNSSDAVRVPEAGVRPQILKFLAKAETSCQTSETVGATEAGDRELNDRKVGLRRWRYPNQVSW